VNDPTARREIFASIEGFYNRQGLHLGQGFMMPLELEPRVSAS